MNYKIAIDGPGSSGKSTTAVELSKKLSFIYVDTGAMYRTVGLYCLRNNVDLENEEEVVKVLDDINMEFFYVDGVQQIKLNGENVSKEIRENDISTCASIISKYEKVREKLVAIQRGLANNNSIIMDGRDIGTVVLPDADLKIFLTARDEVRAERRYKELKEKGQDVTYEGILKDLRDRDYRDTHRENSPLKQADDAILVDTSDMTKEEVVDYIYDLFMKKVGDLNEKND